MSCHISELNVTYTFHEIQKKAPKTNYVNYQLYDKIFTMAQVIFLENYTCFYSGRYSKGKWSEFQIKKKKYFQVLLLIIKKKKTFEIWFWLYFHKIRIALIIFIWFEKEKRTSQSLANFQKQKMRGKNQHARFVHFCETFHGRASTLENWTELGWNSF